MSKAVKSKVDDKRYLRTPGVTKPKDMSLKEGKRLRSWAWQEAQRRLRDAHPAEFRRLYREAWGQAMENTPPRVRGEE